MLSIAEQYSAICNHKTVKRSDADYKTKLKAKGTSEQILALMKEWDREVETVQISEATGLAIHLVTHALRRLEKRGDVVFTRKIQAKNVRICLFKLADKKEDRNENHSAPVPAKTASNTSNR